MHDMNYAVDFAEPVEANDPCKEPFRVWSMPMSLDTILCRSHSEEPHRDPRGSATSYGSLLSWQPKGYPRSQRISAVAPKSGTELELELEAFTPVLV